MSVNQSRVNSYFVMGSKLYMKNLSNRNKYVIEIKSLKTENFCDL